MKRRIVITFRKDYPAEGLRLALESRFGGLGEIAYVGEDPTVLYIHPRRDLKEDVLKETLEELRAGGELTYVDERR